MRKWEGIVVHWSDSGKDTTVDQIRGWHKSKGWQDIGYHYVITYDGEIKHGRSLDLDGAHCPGKNKTHIGICLVASPTTDATDKQLNELAYLIKVLRRKYDTINEVIGHKDAYPTMCPGNKIYKWLLQLNNKNG